MVHFVLVNFLSCYVSGFLTGVNVLRKKENFWILIFQIVNEILVDVMVAFASDMNGHVRRINAGYSGILRKDDDNLVKRCITLEVEGARQNKEVRPGKLGKRLWTGMWMIST